MQFGRRYAAQHPPPDNLMRSAQGTQKSTARNATRASLTVVIVSSGKAAVAQRAAQALKGASGDFAAQFIVVSQEEDPCFVATVELSGAEFVCAPIGSTRAEMCDLGMRRAHGAIVAVRDDVAVGDAQWLDSFLAVLPAREPATPRMAPTESVVMDTLVTGRAARADGPSSFGTLEAITRIASIEMSAAI